MVGVVVFGGYVGEGVVVGADVDGGGYGVGERGGGVEGAAAGRGGERGGGRVIGGGRWGRDDQTAGVDWVDGDLRAGEEIEGLVELCLVGGFGLGGCGDGGVWVRQEVEREGAGEPEEIFAAGEGGEIVGQ